MSLHLCLLFLFLSLDGLAHGNSPTWPTSCSMSLYTGKQPRVHYISTSQHGPEPQCRGMCEGNSSCGMYRWSTTNKLCWLYPTSLELVTQVMGVEEGVLMNSDPNHNTGSKKCEGLVYDHSHCPDYPKKYTRKRPHKEHKMFSVNLFTTTVTPSQCQDLCTTYRQCRSVVHYVNYCCTYCILYSTTITELMESGKEDEVQTNSYSTTYERYCGDVPYHTSTTE